jgi:hypothetical protein
VAHELNVRDPKSSINGGADFAFGANTEAGGGGKPPVPPPLAPPGNAEPPGDDCPPDPFEPASLRLSQGLRSGLGVKKAILTIPVRKPDKSWFVRTHPASEYRLETAVIELKEDRETYLVDPRLWDELATEATFGPRALFTAMNRQGVLFVWHVKLPGADGRGDEWSRSALEAADMAGSTWVRVQANMSLGAYEVYQARGDIPEPVWPELTLQQILRIAFRDRFIDSMEHPVIRRLRGEV